MIQICSGKRWTDHRRPMCADTVSPAQHRYPEFRGLFVTRWNSTRGANTGLGPFVPSIGGFHNRHNGSKPPR